MKGILRYGGLVLGGLLVFTSLARAQQATSAPVMIEYYYKLAPGATKEWLALYKKNHNPILQQHMKSGLLLSERLFERRYHAIAPAWDYKIVMVWRDGAALDQARQREQEIIRSLYPNQDDHDRQERRRWVFTVEHWDDVLNEVALD